MLYFGYAGPLQAHVEQYSSHVGLLLCPIGSCWAMLGRCWVMLGNVEPLLSHLGHVEPFWAELARD